MRKVLIIALLAMPGLLLADTTPVPFSSTLNLAEHINDSISVPANAQLTIHIINMAPANVARHAYDIHYEQYTVAPEPINTEGVFKAEEQTTTEFVANVPLTTTPTLTPAQALATQRIKMLKAEVDETKVAAEVADLNAALAALDTSTDSALIDAGNAAIASTQQDLTLDQIVLGTDQGLILTIHRGPVGELKEQPWRRDFHVGGPGKFVSNYVFGFAPKLDEQYFAGPSTKTGEFVVSRTVRRDKVTYVPMVLFSWIPASKGNDAFISGPAAGLGYDLSNLVVAGSYLWTWHRNLGVTVGVMAQKQERLKGIYHLKDKVDANTTLTEPVWRPNVFIGISIRSVSALFR